MLKAFLKNWYRNCWGATELYNRYSYMEVYNLIADYERKYPVETWLDRGIGVWPLVRTQLALGLCYVQKLTLSQKILYPVIRRIQHWKAWGKHYLFPRKAIIQQAEKSGSKIPAFSEHPELLQDAQVLLYDTSALNPDGKSSRYVAQIAPLLDMKIPAVRLSLDYLPEPPSRLNLTTMRLDFKKNCSNMSAGPVPRWMKKYRSSLLKLGMRPSNLRQEVSNLLGNAERYEQCLKKSQIRLVLLCAWYQYPCMALIIACRRLGIPVFDLQHGMTGLHPMYSNWRKVPETANSLLPTGFWCWGFEARQTLLFNTVPLVPESMIFCAGNWNLLKELHSQTHCNQELYNELKNKIAGRKTILCGFSRIDEAKFSLVLQIIKKYGDQYFWLFRFHPADPQQKTFTERLENMLNLPVDGYASNILTVSEVFSLSSVLISEISTLFWEGLLWGVSGVMLGGNAQQAFAAGIQDGTLLHVEKAEELEEAVLNAMKISPERCRKTAKKVFASPEEALSEIKRLISVFHLETKI